MCWCSTPMASPKRSTTNDEEFGEDRLLRVIMENRHRPAQEIMEQILAAITTFAGERPQHDDITIMVLRAL